MKMRSNRSVNCWVATPVSAFADHRGQPRSVESAPEPRDLDVELARAPFIVPANNRDDAGTSSATPLARGRVGDGPLVDQDALAGERRAWLTLLVPATTNPSAGIRSFGLDDHHVAQRQLFDGDLVSPASGPHGGGFQGQLAQRPMAATGPAHGAALEGVAQAEQRQQERASSHLPSAAAPAAATSIRGSRSRTGG